jgi:hypothetical protein
VVGWVPTMNMIDIIEVMIGVSVTLLVITCLCSLVWVF